MLFEELISYENLYRAHRSARLGKRYKKEVIEFEMQLSQNLWAMHYDLLYDKYQMGAYHRFMIYDPKRREVQAICYRDRVMQHVLCDRFLLPLLDQKLIYYNVACRRGKGTALAVSALRGFMTAHYKKHGKTGYFIKADIHKYFDSIDHARLKEKLRAIIEDASILRLLFHIIDSYHCAPGKGLPLGNQTSQNFALLYLDKLDKRITCTLGTRMYVRYMDDIIILTESKQKAVYLLEELGKAATAELLELHPKSQIIPAKNGISFLGWHFSYGKNGGIVQKAKKESRQRMIKHFKRACYLQKSDIAQVLASYQGYLLQGCGYHTYVSLRGIAASSGRSNDGKI